MRSATKWGQPLDHGHHLRVQFAERIDVVCCDRVGDEGADCGDDDFGDHPLLLGGRSLRRKEEVDEFVEGLSPLLDRLRSCGVDLDEEDAGEAGIARERLEISGEQCADAIRTS